MSVTTARWNDPPAAPGERVLITRYRPRGVPKGQEPWDRWDKRLAPSVAVLDAHLGRRREGRKVVARDLEPISWEEFTRRFQAELEAEPAREALAELRASGDAVLLCYCADPSRCHRALVASALRD